MTIFHYTETRDRTDYKLDFYNPFYLQNYPSESHFPEILTLMKDLDKPTVGPVHLQLFHPSVIRGPWIKLPLVCCEKPSF